MAPHWPEAKRKTLIYVFKAPWHTISRSSKKATNGITVTTRRTPSYTKNRWNFTVFPWDPRGLEAGLCAGIDGNLQLLLEGRHQLVQNPTRTFTRASTWPWYWGLKASGSLQLWGILSLGSLSHLQQEAKQEAKTTSSVATRVTAGLSGQQDPSQEPGFLHLPGLFRDNPLSHLKNCNTANIHI